ncbi:multiple sugar transport system permease protein [Kribbella orskensis]|uniref:Multiple sugar transport system permease protein n=1 Tax=Kribbella orskensis TaxID=2512216 RepID=A0ABY2BC65_9ACTN|nr:MULTISPECIES: sugar ABC transporter permease [Kribbella]TCN34864.1 multiple sugar transport system permease protein [Kribbella sp. VKM Ac-2500]TCO15570.1 multiple sugar transport system permease protein [Kribbella orskensis]
MSSATLQEPAGRTRPAGPPAPRSRSRSVNRQTAAAWLLALPFVALFLAFTAGPVLGSLAMSFTDMKQRDLRTPFAVNGVGIDNYVKALSDETFRKAAFNTAYFVIVGVPLTLIAALAAAVLLDRGVKKFQSLFKVAYYLPVITSIVAIAVIWRFVLAPDSGLLNTVLSWVGIDGPNWLASKTWAMPSLIVMAMWRNFGAAMIIFLAGLQGIPHTVEEAGQIDGASSWQRFRYLILPLLRPTILFTSVTTGIGYLQFFEEPLVMTQGGPLNSTISVSMYTYQQFGFGNYGLATSMSYILFVVIAVVTFIQFRLLREK